MTNACCVCTKVKYVSCLAGLFNGFPGLFTDTSEHIRFYFLVLLFFPLLSFWFRAVN